MNDSPRQRGSAMLAVLLVLGTLLPVGVFAALRARTSLDMMRRGRLVAEAFHAAESGLERALAQVESSPWPARPVDEPDGARGTDDGGPFPFRSAGSDAASYEVWVERSARNRLRLVSWGVSGGDARQGVAAVVAPSDLPFLPAAVFAGASPIDFDLATSFAIDGGSSLPGVAFATADEAVRQVSGLGETGAGGGRGRGGSPSVGTGDFPEVSGLIDSVADGGAATPIGPEASGELGEGLFLSRTALRLRDASGSGVLLVDGNLSVGGTLDFDGVIVARGDVRFDSGSQAQIRGGLVQGDLGRVLLFGGAGAIRYDPGILERVDRLFPGLLPRRARQVSWRRIGLD